MILSVKNLCFSFTEKDKLLNDVSFDLEKAKIYALMGANGSGKTTLFNIISGFLKPNSGSIEIDGTNLGKLKPYEINLVGIGRTFQDLRLITKLTVKDNVILAMRNNPTDNWYDSLLPKGVAKGQLGKMELEAKAIASKYFLDDVFNSLANEISFGQQKLLTLACCEANGADLFLLDEPVAGINPEYAKIIGKLMIQIRDSGKTILFIEHNTDFISSIADRIFFLSGGKMVQYESVDEMKKDSFVKDAYL